MKAITIQGLADIVWSLLKELAKQRNASVNATAKAILEQAMGVQRPREQPHR